MPTAVADSSCGSESVPPLLNTGTLQISGPQKGPAERGHVKKRQKSSKKCRKYFRHFSTFFAQGKKNKNRQKVSKLFSTLFDNLRAAPVFRPLLGRSEQRSDIWNCRSPLKLAKANRAGLEGVRLMAQTRSYYARLLPEVSTR